MQNLSYALVDTCDLIMSYVYAPMLGTGEGDPYVPLGEANRVVPLSMKDKLEALFRFVDITPDGFKYRLLLLRRLLLRNLRQRL